MPITIEDIAKEAGVSKATVSRVMNNTKAVSPEVKERVNRVIEKNQFKPNAFARGLVTKKAQTVGIIVPDIGNPGNGMTMKGLNEICQKEGYTLMVGESNEDVEKEKELIKTFEDKNVDGLILIHTNYDLNYMNELYKKEYPVILIGGEKIKTKNFLNLVYHDIYKASYDATEFILQFGHKYIGFLSKMKTSYDEKRYNGFCDALNSKNIHASDTFIQFGDFSYSSGIECMKKIYENNKELPTAIFVCNDDMAIGAIHYIQSIGLKVPEDVSVMGMDGLYYTSYLKPALTTVEIPYYEEGVMAGQILFDSIKNSVNSTTHYMEHKIIKGDSLIQSEKFSHEKDMEVYLL